MLKRFDNLSGKIPKWGILIVGIVGMLLIAWGELGKQTTSIKPTASESSYEESMVNKMKNILSTVKGVGKLEVILTLSQGYGYDYVVESRKNTNTTEDTGGTSVGRIQQKSETEEKYVLADTGSGKSPIITREYTPVVQGIVVVCEGGENPEVAAHIVDAATVALGIRSSQVSVLPMSNAVTTERILQNS